MVGGGVNTTGGWSGAGWSGAGRSGAGLGVNVVGGCEILYHAPVAVVSCPRAVLFSWTGPAQSVTLGVLPPISPSYKVHTCL